MTACSKTCAGRLLAFEHKSSITTAQLLRMLIGYIKLINFAGKAGQQHVQDLLLTLSDTDENIAWPNLAEQIHR